jgi:hypothetical protein
MRFSCMFRYSWETGLTLFRSAHSIFCGNTYVSPRKVFNMHDLSLKLVVLIPVLCHLFLDSIMRR